MRHRKFLFLRNILVYCWFSLLLSFNTFHFCPCCSSSLCFHCFPLLYCHSLSFKFLSFFHFSFQFFLFICLFTFSGFFGGFPLFWIRVILSFYFHSFLFRSVIFLSSFQCDFIFTSYPRVQHSFSSFGGIRVQCRIAS